MAQARAALRLTASPGRIALVLSGILAALIAAHAGRIVSIYVLDHARLFGLIRLFDFNGEMNVPTFFSTLLLTSSAALLWLYGCSCASGGQRALPWYCLSAIFLFLAVDEFSHIHEMLIEPTRERFGTSGLLYFAWTIPYGIGVALVGVCVAPSVWRLPAKFRTLFIIAGAVYLAGAIGCEMIGGAYYEQTKAPDPLYETFTGIEESLEMSGVILLIYGLLSLLQLRAGAVYVDFGEPPQPDVASRSSSASRATSSAAGNSRESAAAWPAQSE